MKNIFYILSLLLLGVNVKAQTDFENPPESPGSCMMNAFDNKVPAFRGANRRATFMYSVPSIGRSTGTLVNINTSEDDMGTYFVTSWHCFKTGETCGGSTFDFNNNKITFYFNYQSPPNHLGQIFEANDEGEVYEIERYVKLIDRVNCSYGDFALCEILGDPIPPHFNPYYAGWQPSGFTNWDSYANFSHPNGSLKQAALANRATDGYTFNPGTVVCKSVTKLVDFLFGWIWGRKWSTETVCEFTQIPYVETRYTVHEWSEGNVDDGSSGSALFNGNNRIIGTFSGSPDWTQCNTNEFWFGKFTSYYFRRSIKNTLNPENNWGVDVSGIPGRDRNCYDKIDYNYDKPYVFYPAKLYQDNNALAFNSKTYVNLGKNWHNRVTIKEEADFTFNAGTDVVLGNYFTVEPNAKFTANAGNEVVMHPGFEVGEGAMFTAKIGGSTCGSSGNYNHKTAPSTTNYEMDARKQLYERMSSIELPESLDLTTEQATHQMAVSIYPNPAQNIINIHTAYTTSDKLSVTIINSMGTTVYKNNFKVGRGTDLELKLSELNNGIYNVMLQSGENRITKKLEINR